MISERIWTWISRTANRRRGFVLWSAEVSAFVFSCVAAFALRFELSIPRSEWRDLLIGLALLTPVKCIVFRLTNVDRRSWRYASVDDALQLGLANFAASFCAAPFILFFDGRFPRSIILLDLLVCCALTAFIRFFPRMAADWKMKSGSRCAKSVLVYGAGSAGVVLVREIRANPRLNLKVRGFVDDDPGKKDMLVNDVPVLGSGSELSEIVTDRRIDEILIAMPSATGPQMIEIFANCHRAKLRCKTVPSLSEVIQGSALATQLREVAVEDLLGRSPVQLDETAVRSKLAGAVVMVTGAAGSIGSELARQVARFGPRLLVGYDISESGLFDLQQDLARTHPSLTFVPEIGSIQKISRLEEAMRRHRPSILYHAAAYKHVPLLEAHVFEAVENNVLGTYNIAVAAAERGISDVVMISTDKAVHPTSAMGATKRVAELVMLAMPHGGAKYSGTKYVSVRFGNVLGSSGSVVPLFKKQIAAGGPVTVTDPEMRRYFMTIPEAAQLVLQASTMGHGGEIFVLDMGQPIKIADLARNLILLSGLKPEEDIRIEFVGARPGEKLYEELSRIEENTLSTAHQKIRIFGGNGLPAGGMTGYIELLRQLCAQRDLGGLILALRELVPDYSPSTQLLEALLGRRAPEVRVARHGERSEGMTPTEVHAATGMTN